MWAWKRTQMPQWGEVRVLFMSLSPNKGRRGVASTPVPQIHEDHFVGDWRTALSCENCQMHITKMLTNKATGLREKQGYMTYHCMKHGWVRWDVWIVLMLVSSDDRRVQSGQEEDPKTSVSILQDPQVLPRGLESHGSAPVVGRKMALYASLMR